VRRYVDYNLCGLNNPKTIQEAEFPFKIIKCTNCGLVYTNPQPDRKLIKDHYQEDYYKEWIEKQMNRRIHMRERRLRDLVKYKKSGRTFQAKEWHLYHFSDHTISSMLEKAGFDIIKIDLDLVQLEPSKITADFLAVIFHFVTRKNYGEAMRVYAIKAQKNN